jgi:Cd2+/Zn2+-exporting ATPase
MAHDHAHHDHDHAHGHAHAHAHAPGDTHELAHAVGLHTHGKVHEDESERRIDAKIFAALAGGMLLIAAVIAKFVFDTPEQSDMFAILASILLGVPIIYDAAKHLLPSSHGHEHGNHMEELIALAILASFASGQYLECGAVAFFMLIANFIEHRTAVGALHQIESLIRITPTKAKLLQEDGSEAEVEASQLQPGDVVVVRPGDSVPGDGQIRAGQSTLNEANITGESLPVEKATGDEVFNGTINESGRLEVEITRAGEDSTLGQVQKLIIQAAASKPVVVRMLERYAAYYTPTVLMIAAVIFVFTRDLSASISLLLIACPCAIILAGPTATVASLSAAARLGVYIKNVTDLEVARRITAIILDKTGTLTEGKLAVTRIQPAEGVDPAELLRLCAAAEADSKHPVARAVAAVADKAKLDLPKPASFEEVAGRGVVATIDGQQVRVGRETWLNEQGVSFGGLSREGSEGLSLLFVARGDQVIGWVGLEDTIRANAKASMDALDELGVQRRVMITGDRQSPAARVAAAIDMTDFEAEALPGDKLRLVETLKEKGHTVAVVGDGVNDGPALAAGDVSIAMGAAGSDVAIQSATVALMNSQLDRIPFLFRLSRRTVSVIRQNLIGVLIYILIMLGLLAVGYMTPLIAAIGHGISSIIVVFNSARLIREGEHLETFEPQSQTPRHRPQLQRVQPAPATA